MWRDPSAVSDLPHSAGQLRFMAGQDGRRSAPAPHQGPVKVTVWAAFARHRGDETERHLPPAEPRTFNMDFGEILKALRRAWRFDRRGVAVFVGANSFPTSAG